MIDREKNIQDIKIAYHWLGKIVVSDDDCELKQLKSEELKELRKYLGGAKDYLQYNHIA